MPRTKRAVHLSKQKARVKRTGGANKDQRFALTQARTVLDRRLTDLNSEYKPQIERLQRELREKRQKAHDDFAERRRMIEQATILDIVKG